MIAAEHKYYGGKKCNKNNDRIIIMMKVYSGGTTTHSSADLYKIFWKCPMRSYKIYYIFCCFIFFIGHQRNIFYLCAYAAPAKRTKSTLTL